MLLVMLGKKDPKFDCKNNRISSFYIFHTQILLRAFDVKVIKSDLVEF